MRESLRVCPLGFELRDGRLHFSGPLGCRVALFGAAPRVRGRTGSREFDWLAAPLRAQGDTLVAQRDDLGLALELRVRQVGDAWELRAVLQNRGSSSLTVDEIAPLSVQGDIAIGAGTDRWSVLRNGYQSWSGTRAYDLSAADADPLWRFLRVSHTDVKHRAAGRAGSVRSDLYTAIKNLRSGEVLCAGFTGGAAAFGAVSVEWTARSARVLSAACDYDGVALAPGSEVASETLWLAAGHDENELLGRYADALGRAMQARVPEHSPTGWCSWYHYFTRIDEPAVLENLEALGRRWPCDFMIVDDGWQRAIGDWDRCNAKFPHGMRWLAEQIRSAGMRAGLWLGGIL